MLIASDGEKYSPEGIEEALVKKSTFIEQVMLHNNQDPYTIALIVPNKEALKNELKESGLTIRDNEGQKKAIEIIQKDID